MYKTRLLGFLGLFLFATINVFAKIPPAEWTHNSLVEAKVGDVVEIVFTTDIPDGYHIYGSVDKCNGMGPLIATIRMEESKNVELVGTLKQIGAEAHLDEIFNCDVYEFHHKAKFIQKVKITAANPVIQGILDYQMCTESACVFFEYEFETKVKGKSGQIKQVTPVKPDPKVKTTEVIEPSVEQGSQEDPKKDDPELVTIDPEETEDGQAGKEATSEPIMSEVDYSTYQATTENDTAKCVEKTFNGEGSENKQSYWGLFILAFLSGLAALLTPCVFPMIPMTVSFFMKDGDKGKSIRTGLIYGLSIVAIYVLIGALIGIFSSDASFANWLSTAWLPNVLFFLIFVVFAASFFGAFELTLPSWMVNKVDKQADKGGLMGVFFMAFTIVLVSFSCTGPIVGAILVNSTGALIKPIIGMLGFSLAFAIPFTLFAIFPSWLNNLPQSGGWLNSVKVVLGFVELALGLKFLSVADQTYHWGILDREIYIGLWIVIFFLMGLYLLGKIKFAHDSDLPYLKVPRLFFTIATFAFVVYLIPGLWGAPLKFLSGYLPPMSTHDFNLLANEVEHGDKKYADVLHQPHGIDGYFDYEEGMKAAREMGKPVLVDFTGHGCVNCRKMEEKVWSDKKVLSYLKDDYVVISLFVDDKTIKLPENEWFSRKGDGKIIKTLAKKNATIQECYFNENSQPQYVLMDNQGNLLQKPRHYDEDITEYTQWLKDGLNLYQSRILSNSDQEVSTTTP